MMQKRNTAATDAQLPALLASAGRDLLPPRESSPCPPASTPQRRGGLEICRQTDTYTCQIESNTHLILNIRVVRMLTQQKQIETDVGSRVMAMRRSRPVEEEDEEERPFEVSRRCACSSVGHDRWRNQLGYDLFASWKRSLVKEACTWDRMQGLFYLILRL